MRSIYLRRPAASFTVIYVLLLSALLPTDTVFARNNDPRTIRITLGDFRFSPSQLSIEAGQPVILELANTDGFTPHNFTLKDRAGGLDIDVDVSAGKVVKIPLTPQVPGSYVFYCNKKLPFMKSHRMRGMEGTLAVIP